MAMVINVSGTLSSGWTQTATWIEPRTKSMTANQIVDFLLEAVVEDPEAVDELITAAVRIRNRHARTVPNTPRRAGEGRSYWEEELIELLNEDPAWIKHGVSIDRKLGAAAAYLRPGPDRKPGRIALSADVDGVEAFLARGDTKILRLILEHELIHKEQHRRTNWKPGKHRGTKSPGYSTRLLRKYCNNPQEIMAYAHNYVHGGEYSRAEMMQKITQGMRKGDAVFTWLSPANKKRAMRYAVQYAQKLPH